MSEFKVGDRVGADNWVSEGLHYGTVTALFGTGSCLVRWDGDPGEGAVAATDLILIDTEPTEGTDSGLISAYRKVNEDLATRLAWEEGSRQMQGETIAGLRRELEEARLAYRASQGRITELTEAVRDWRQTLLVGLLRAGLSTERLGEIVRRLDKACGLGTDPGPVGLMEALKASIEATKANTEGGLKQ